MDPVGVHQFWGFSPALDLHQISSSIFGPSFPYGHDVFHMEEGLQKGTRSVESPKADDESIPPPNPEEPDERINILLAMSGDPRHVLKTIAQRRRNSNRPLHFYIHEKFPEELCRHLVLLYVAFDFSIPIRQRATMWLEIYGNLTIQERTATYIATIRPRLLDWLCDGHDPLPTSGGEFDFLRHRQRNSMDEALQLWNMTPEDALAVHDARLRAKYADRFDYRVNMFDWDYQSVIRPSSGHLHWKTYKRWRLDGVGFEFSDQTYNFANKTMLGYADGRERGLSVSRRGFWGNMAVAPHHAVGGAAPGHGYGGQLFDIVSRHSGTEQWRHDSVEVSMYNVISWLFEIETGNQYVMKKEHDIFSGLGSGELTGSAGDSITGSNLSVSESVQKSVFSAASTISQSLSNVHLHFLLGDFETEVLSPEKTHIMAALRSRIHCVAAGVRFAAVLMNPRFNLLLSSRGCAVVLETARNVASLQQKERADFLKRLLSVGSRRGYALVGTDRTLSADSFAVGTVIDLDKHARSGGSAGKEKEKSSSSLSFISAIDGRVIGLRPLPWDSVSKYINEPLAFPLSGSGSGSSSSTRGSSNGLTSSDSSEPSLKAKSRAKQIPFVFFSQLLPPLPIVEACLQLSLNSLSSSSPSTSSSLHSNVDSSSSFTSNEINADASSSTSGSTESASEDAKAAVVHEIISTARSYIRGIDKHDVFGGDNPHPEAIVFAYLPNVANAVEQSVVSMDASSSSTSKSRQKERERDRNEKGKENE